MIVKQQIFAVPGSTGNHNFNISGWGDTPVAAMFQLIGTDGTDSFDNTGNIAVGFTDGTNQGVESMYMPDNLATTAPRRGSNDAFVVRTAANTSGAMDIAAAFNSWNTGGVSLTWSGADIATHNHQVLVTFFAGADVSAAVLYATGNVTTLSFTSKLILSACIGTGSDSEGAWGNLNVGVCTNGTNGLTQGMIEYNNEEAVGTTDLGIGMENAYTSGQEFSGWNWRSAVSSVGATGFNFDTPGGSDRVLMLCLTCDNDIDSGVATIPTTGAIAVTDPGFTPQFVGLWGVPAPSLNTWYSNEDPSGMFMGGYDGTRENSIAIASADGAATTDETSIHSSKILHFEDPAQSVQFISNAITLDAAGFDITMTTNPGTALATLIWLAIEEEAASGAMSGDIVGAATVTGALSIDAGMTVRSAIFNVPTSSGTADFQISGYGDTPVAAKFVLIGTDATDGRDAGTIMSIGATDGTNDVVAGWWADDNLSGTTLRRYLQSDACILRLEAGASRVIEADFSSWLTGGVRLTWAGADLATNNHQVLVTFFSGPGVQADVLTVSPGETVSSLSYEASLLFSGCAGTGPASDDAFGCLVHGIATNGTNGLTQNAVCISQDDVATTTVVTRLLSDHFAGQVFGTTPDWESAITSVTSTGFVLDSSDTDDFWVLAIYSPLDVDSGTVSIPTSGNISETTPGFEPGFVGLAALTVTALDTSDTSSADQVLSIGEYDGENENSVGTYSEDAVTTTNESSFHNSDILHAEDDAGTAIYDGGFNQFTANGFDITMNSWPGSAMYLLWWVTEMYLLDAVLAGDIVGTSVVTGDLDGSAALSGDIVGTTAVTGAMDATANMAGDITGAATVTGDLRGDAALASDVVGTAVVTGDLRGAADLAASVTGTAIVAGTLQGTADLAGDITGAAVVAGDLKGAAALAGDITGTAVVTGNLDTDQGFEGAIVGTSVVTGDLRGALTMSGDAVGTSVVTGALSGQIELSGDITGTSAVTGDLKGVSDLAGDIIAEAIVTGSLSVGSGFFGAITGTSAVTGAMSVLSSLAGDITGTTDVSGDLKGALDMAGDIVGTSILQGDLKGSLPLLGDIVGTSVTTGALSGSAALAGDIVGSSALTGDFKRLTVLASDIVGTSVVSGDMRRLTEMYSNIVGTSVVTGILLPLGVETVWEIIEAESRMTPILKATSEMTDVLELDSYLRTIKKAVSTMTPLLTEESKMTTVLKLKSYM